MPTTMLLCRDTFGYESICCPSPHPFHPFPRDRIPSPHQSDPGHHQKVVALGVKHQALLERLGRIEADVTAAVSQHESREAISAEEERKVSCRVSLQCSLSVFTPTYPFSFFVRPTGHTLFDGSSHETTRYSPKAPHVYP